MRAMLRKTLITILMVTAISSILVVAWSCAAVYGILFYLLAYAIY
jgi:hypothetical protein